MRTRMCLLAVRTDQVPDLMLLGTPSPTHHPNHHGTVAPAHSVAAALQLSHDLSLVHSSTASKQNLSDANGSLRYACRWTLHCILHLSCGTVQICGLIPTPALSQTWRQALRR